MGSQGDAFWAELWAPLTGRYRTHLAEINDVGNDRFEVVWRGPLPASMWGLLNPFVARGIVRLVRRQPEAMTFFSRHLQDRLWHEFGARVDVGATEEVGPEGQHGGRGALLLVVEDDAGEVDAMRDLIAAVSRDYGIDVYLVEPA